MLFRRAHRFPGKILLFEFMRTLIVEFSKVTLCDRRSFIQGPWDFIVALEKITKVITFHPNSLITNFSWLFTGCLISMLCPHAFLCGPRLCARRVFIQRSGRLALALRYLHQEFISNLLLQIIVDFSISKRKSCSERPLAHLMMLYRYSTLFPISAERKLERNSAVDETVAREHQVLLLYTRL